MAHPFKYREIEDLRTESVDPTGDVTYQRFFEVPPGELANAPALGAQLPDKLGTDTYDSLTGPYVVSAPERQKRSAKDGSASMVLIRITGRKLAAASGATASGGYIELHKRTPVRTADGIAYRTLGVASSDSAAGLPRLGDILTGTVLTHRDKARCTAVACDNDSQPGRTMVSARWDAILYRDEDYP